MARIYSILKTGMTKFRISIPSRGMKINRNKAIDTIPLGGFRDADYFSLFL
jgi:hypothetical protein